MKRLSIFIFLFSLMISVYSKDFKVGDDRSFWQFDVVKGEKEMEKGYYQTDFKCISNSERSYIFIEKDLLDGKNENQPIIKKMQERFDNYYPKLKEFFGTPSDLDRNGKFIILIADIRDWFYYNMKIEDGMEPILGYYWFEFNKRNKNDYLTMDIKQKEIDAYGTLMHEYFHNIYDKVNSNPENFVDRAVNEALAHYAIFINGTMAQDEYCNWQFSILKEDLKKNKLLNAFDGTHNYFDIANKDLHHCYAAGYYFIKYVADRLIKDDSKKKLFIHSLIYDKVNGTSLEKMLFSLKKAKVIRNNTDFNKLYFGGFKAYLRKSL